MTLASTTNRNDYDGNGTTAAYAYSFKIFSSAHLLVTVRDDSDDSETTLTSDQYSVDGVGDPSGGNVTLVDSGEAWFDGSSFLDTGYHLTIRRVVPITQLTDIRNQGDFYPEAHEDQFDLLIMIDQQQQDDIDRSIKLMETSELSDLEIPDPEADKAWFWNALGTAVEYRSLTVTSGTYPGDFSAGLDANKAASPSTNDIYIATDTTILYICFSSGTWTNLSKVSVGLDANKAASPAVGSVYIATDNNRLYTCRSAGTWTYSQEINALTVATITATGAITGTNATMSGYVKADQILRVVESITYASSITPDASTGDYKAVGALTGNITINNPTNAPSSGETMTLVIVLEQDGTGGRTVTWGSKFRFNDNISDTNPLSGASDITYFGFIYNQPDDKWDCVSRIPFSI